LAVAACSGGSALPPASDDAPAVTGPAVSPSIVGKENGTMTTAGANPCANPKWPTVCVQQGEYGSLGLQETCGGTKAKCGAVRWSTKTSNKGLTAYFQPNPGNGTTEIVDAFITMKVGRYSQTIKIVCAKDKGCVKNPLKATIYVTKNVGKM
jgi:hypothetical protein